MKPFNNLILNYNSTIKEALNVINEGEMRIAFIVDEQGKLLGILSDGDIRRAFLNNYTLENTIEKIFNKNYIYSQVGDSKDKIIELANFHQVYQIPILDDKMILVGIEELNSLITQPLRSNKIVLMVGGLGTRLRPLTDEVPKPLLKVANKPILEIIIENFSKYGFKEFILSVNYKSKMIEDYFGNGSKFGVNIEYINETQRMGTAGALSLMEDKLKESFFVMNGDLLTDINFEHLLKFHIENKCQATMCVREYDLQIPYGVVNINNKYIQSIEEKPLHTFCVNAGIYILEPSILKYVPKNKFYDMPTLFETIIENKYKAISFPIKDYWLDIGEIEQYKKANLEYGNIFRDNLHE